MKIKVHLFAFGNGVIREVEIPDREFAAPLAVFLGKKTLPEYILERVFYWGQNDFQPQQFPSVSAGDVIEYEDKLYLISPRGFKLLNRLEFQKRVDTLKGVVNDDCS
jgi:hypothetical protein